MLEFIRSKNGFKSYQADNFRIYYGEKGAIAGDNNKNPKETIYLIDGKLKVRIKEMTKIEIAPAEIKIPAKTYHKISALTTNTKFLVIE